MPRVSTFLQALLKFLKDILKGPLKRGLFYYMHIEFLMCFIYINYVTVKTITTMIKKIFIWVWIVFGIFASYKALTMNQERSEYFEATVTSVNKQTIPYFRGFRYEYSYDFTINSTGDRGSETVDYREYKETKVGDTKTVLRQLPTTVTLDQVGYSVTAYVWLLTMVGMGVNKLSK